MGTNMRTESFRGNQLNFSSKKFLEIKRKLHEIIKSVLLRIKLDKNINIACRCLLFSDKGTKQTNPPDTQFSEALICFLKALD